MDLTSIQSWKKVYLDDLQSVSLDLIETIEPKAVIILDGDLGAGKTTLTQKFIENYLSSSQYDLFSNDVTSPTYSLINEFGSMAHADLYRLETPEELVHLEIELYLDQKDYFLVEWGMNFVKYLHAQIPVDWRIYTLKVTTNPLKEGQQTASRNFELSRIDL